MLFVARPNQEPYFTSFKINKVGVKVRKNEVKLLKESNEHDQKSDSETKEEVVNEKEQASTFYKVSSKIIPKGAATVRLCLEDVKVKPMLVDKNGKQRDNPFMLLSMNKSTASIFQNYENHLCDLLSIPYERVVSSVTQSTETDFYGQPYDPSVIVSIPLRWNKRKGKYTDPTCAVFVDNKNGYYAHKPLSYLRDPKETFEGRVLLSQTGVVAKDGFVNGKCPIYITWKIVQMRVKPSMNNKRDVELASTTQCLLMNSAFEKKKKRRTTSGRKRKATTSEIDLRALEEDDDEDSDKSPVEIGRAHV